MAQNYFEANIKRAGNIDNFIILMKPEQIQRDAKNRIFREMVQGRIDYEKYGNYYLDSKFLENIIISANNELMNSVVIARALESYDLTYPGDRLVVMNKNKFNGLVFVYSTIYDRLCTVKETQNVASLVDIQYVLSNFRNLL